TWIQQVAQGWLVLELTDSAFAVGLVTTLGSLPILLFTLYGGLLADRVNRRRFLVLLQSLMLMEALALGLLTATGRITVEWVMILAVLFGLLSAFEVPVRQAFTADMVAKADLMNAIALNSSAFNLARVVGPAAAGILIASAGISACFFANAASYLAVLAGLSRMRVEPPGVVQRRDARSALAEGFVHVLGNRWPRALVVLIAGFSLFGFPFMTMAPVFARDALGVGATGYAALVSAVGLGAAAAALFLAGWGTRFRKGRLLAVASILFGCTLAAAALVHRYWPSLVLFTAAGWSMAANGILANTLLQIHAPDRLRGRVMGVYSFLVLGLAPIGSFQAGWVSEHLGVAWSIGLGGVACALIAAWTMWYLGRPSAQPLAGDARSARDAAVA
ncbi:MAG TPA: MFS transporter, partial [Gemmatimonadales bacterium]|nr:MFS transporter [Gemmatimonadales bacterium]